MEIFTLRNRNELLNKFILLCKQFVVLLNTLSHFRNVACELFYICSELLIFNRL